ncbi:10704_t:CDS:2 [Cetraspora pellucida]|uniref:10704_t:CDS:1 n=1 Tax=Cetraspora pellucida TaxID=1433469 RepID=A0A9N8W8W8_9GLOM|nr:10704_t:CDS:2 [Cetraspora pellucida]
MSSLIPKRPKLLNTRAKKKDFDLSSKQEKTSIIEAETANIPYLPNSKPSKNNNQGDKNWASNIEQKEKPVGKDKQKATSFTNENNKDVTFKENTTSIPISKHGSPLKKANHKNINNATPATNHDQDITMEPLDCNKENKIEEKKFTLVTSKKNNRKENKKKTLTTSEESKKSKTENA